MSIPLAGKTQHCRVENATGRRLGWLERAMCGCGRLAAFSLALAPFAADTALGGEPPSLPRPSQAATITAPVQYVQNAPPAALPPRMAAPNLGAAAQLPPNPIPDAPTSLIEGPTAEAAGCASTGRADFFPFEFNKFTVRMDAIWFRRDTNGDQLLANGVINATGQAFALDTEADLDIESLNPGVRVFAEKAVGDCTSYVNGSFMWFQKMNTSTTLDNNLGVTITRGAGGFGFAATQRQDVTYDNILYIADFSYREDFGNFSLSIGPRFTHLEENLEIQETGFFNDAFRGNVNATGRRNTFTYNDMIGLQIGADYFEEVGRFITVGGFGRACVMANYSGYRIDQGVSDSIVGPIVRTNRVSTANLAGVFEMGMVATVRLTSNAFLRGGYQILYMPGLAIAPDQFIPDLIGFDTSDVDRKGTGFFYGPFCGLEIRWGLCE